MLKYKLVAGALAGALVAAVSVAPAPVRAAAGVDFYISGNAAAASVGVGTGCALPDVQYDAEDGLEGALAAIYEDPEYGDNFDTIILCDIDLDAGDVDYVMHSDVAIDDDGDAGTPDAATYDATDGLEPIDLTIRGNAEDADSIIIDADDNDDEDTGGFSPFDFTDTNLTIRNMTILNAWDDSAGAAIHHIQGESAGTLLTLDTVVIEYAYSTGGDGAGVWSGNDVDVYDSIFEYNGFGTVSCAVCSGAAIYANGTVEVNNSTFEYNVATLNGGAIHADEVIITGSQFYGNGADEDGGAIRAVNAFIYTSEFEANGADDDGGAVYAQNDLTIEDSTFTDNNTLDEGGAVYADDDLDVIDSEFNLNDAGQEGGAIFVDEDSVEISGTSFIGNSAGDDGGALSHDDDDDDSPSVNIIDCVFKDNEAGDDGGAVALDWAIDLLADSLFSGNRADQSEDSEWIGDGGVLRVDDGIRDEDDDGESGIHNNVFIGNEAENGGVLWLDEIDASDEIVGNRFINNLATENGGGIWMLDDGDNGELIKLQRNFFSVNRAQGMGGGVYMDLRFATALPDQRTFSRNTFTRNFAAWGGGLTIDGLEGCESKPISSREVARSLKSNKFSKNRGGGSRNANAAAYCTPMPD